MIVSHPGPNPGRVLLPFTHNDMLCDSVFSPSQCILAVGKSLLSFLFLLISRPFFATPGTVLFLWLLIISLCVHCHDSDFFYLLLSSIASLMFVSLLPYPSSFLFLFSYFSCYFFISHGCSLLRREGFSFFCFSKWISHSHVARWLPMIDELYVCRL